MINGRKVDFKNKHIIITTMNPSIRKTSHILSKPPGPKDTFHVIAMPKDDEEADLKTKYDEMKTNTLSVVAYARSLTAQSVLEEKSVKRLRAQFFTGLQLYSSEYEILLDHVVKRMISGKFQDVKSSKERKDWLLKNIGPLALSKTKKLVLYERVSIAALNVFDSSRAAKAVHATLVHYYATKNENNLDFEAVGSFPAVEDIDYSKSKLQFSELVTAGTRKEFVKKFREGVKQLKGYSRNSQLRSAGREDFEYTWNYRRLNDIALAGQSTTFRVGQEIAMYPDQHVAFLWKALSVYAVLMSQKSEHQSCLDYFQDLYIKSSKKPSSFGINCILKPRIADVEQLNDCPIAAGLGPIVFGSALFLLRFEPEMWFDGSTWWWTKWYVPSKLYTGNLSSALDLPQDAFFQDDNLGVNTHIFVENRKLEIVEYKAKLLHERLSVFQTVNPFSPPKRDNYLKVLLEIAALAKACGINATEHCAVYKKYEGNLSELDSFRNKLGLPYARRCYASFDRSSGDDQLRPTSQPSPSLFPDAPLFFKEFLQGVVLGARDKDAQYHYYLGSVYNEKDPDFLTSLKMQQIKLAEPLLHTPLQPSDTPIGGLYDRFTTIENFQNNSPPWKTAALHGAATQFFEGGYDYTLDANLFRKSMEFTGEIERFPPSLVRVSPALLEDTNGERAIINLKREASNGDQLQNWIVQHVKRVVLHDAHNTPDLHSLVSGTYLLVNGRKENGALKLWLWTQMVMI